MKNLPSKNPPQPQSQQKTVSLSHDFFAGPLPSPDILIRYNQALPGAADRIISMAEHDSSHLQAMERVRLTAVYNERRLGQILGFCIAFLGLAASVYLGSSGHEITASVIGGTTLVGLVSVFVIGRISKATNIDK